MGPEVRAGQWVAKDTLLHIELRRSFLGRHTGLGEDLRRIWRPENGYEPLPRWDLDEPLGGLTPLGKANFLSDSI